MNEVSAKALIRSINRASANGEGALAAELTNDLLGKEAGGMVDALAREPWVHTVEIDVGPAGLTISVIYKGATVTGARRIPTLTVARP